MEKKTGKIRDKWSGLAIALVALSIYTALLASYYFQFRCIEICEKTTQADWGQLGDFLGGILNPLLTAIVMTIAFKTYTEQKKAFKDEQEINNTQQFLECTNRILTRIENILHKKLKNPDIYPQHFDSDYKYDTLLEALEVIFNEFLGDTSHNNDKSRFDASKWRRITNHLNRDLKDVFNCLYAIDIIATSVSVERKVLSSQLISTTSMSSITSIIFLIKYLEHQTEKSENRTDQEKESFTLKNRKVREMLTDVIEDFSSELVFKNFQKTFENVDSRIKTFC